MAKKMCELCGRQLASDMVMGVSLCAECRALYSGLVRGVPEVISQAGDGNLYSRATEKAVKLFRDTVGRYGDRAERVREEQERQQAIQANLTNMIMTTGGSFEGYRVVEYIDVLCEEVVFKNSFWKQLGAGFEDLGNALSFSEREMSGATELIANAREYIMRKFKAQAARIGANGLLGVEFESSLGSDLVRVSVSGTAVRIEKTEAC